MPGKPAWMAWGIFFCPWMKWTEEFRNYFRCPHRAHSIRSGHLQLKVTNSGEGAEKSRKTSDSGGNKQNKEKIENCKTLPLKSKTVSRRRCPLKVLHGRTGRQRYALSVRKTAMNLTAGGFLIPANVKSWRKATVLCAQGSVITANTSKKTRNT